MFLKNVDAIAIYQIRILSTASFCHFLSFLFAKHITRYFRLKFHLGLRCKDGPSLGCPNLVNIFYVFYFKGNHMGDQRHWRPKTKKCSPSYVKEIYYILSSQRVGTLQASKLVRL